MRNSRALKCAVALLLTVCVRSALAQTAMTAEDLGTFFDEHATREMKKADVAGAAIVIVKDDKVLFARGYGYADVERKTPVSTGDTLFRIASISKVVTYTAVMQLVEQGKIDLDADVARYLDFSIPATFAQPITMRHLMMHTTGFDETVEGRWVGPGKLGPLRDYLVRQMPKRLYAPGTVPSYSSYGTTLAGYVVERVSGETFETYIERHIFAPLGMRHSSFAQPLPPSLAPMLTKGYATGSGPAASFDTAQAVPATSMSSSAADMAQFMLAHLRGNAAPGPSLLMPATLAQMHTVQYRHHPAAPGIALGLYEMDEAAQRVLGHHGDIPGFHSGLYLLPEQRIGVLILQNTEAGPNMRTALLKSFVDRYLAPLPHAAALPPSAALAEMSGSYLTSRRFDTSPLSLSYLLGQSVVRVARPGTLVIDTHLGLDGKPVEWHEVASGVWQSAANPIRHLYFRKNALGDWEMSNSRDPVQVMQMVPWYRHKLFILWGLALSVGALLLSVLSWPFPALRLPLRMRVTGLLMLSPWLVYGGTGLVIMNDLLFVSSPTCSVLLRVVQALSWLAAGGAIFAVREALAVRRVHQVLFALAGLGATVVAGLGGFLIWSGVY